MKQIILPILTFTAIAGPLNATTLVFNNLNSALDIASGNTLDVAGNQTGLSVTRSASGDDFLYSVTYNGADYDGDALADTLTFDVLVEGWEGGSSTLGSSNNNTDSSATIGVNSTQVALQASDNTWGPQTAGRFDGNEALQLSLTSFNVLLTGSGSASAVSTGFTQVLLDESAGLGHRAIFGSGTGLDGNTFNANLNKTLNANYGTGDLFVSAINGSGSNNRRYAATNVDFGVEVTVVPIPEPSSALLLSIGGIALVLRRRK